MVTVDRSIVINKPVQEVFSYVANPQRIPEWRKDILATTARSGPSVGMEFVETINFMGKKPFTMKIRELEPNRKQVIENIAGPGVRPIQTFTFDPQGNSTVVNIHVDVRTSGLFRLLEPMLPKMIGKNWEGYLTTLKHRLEN